MIEKADTKIPVLVLGAGLAGLSTAYHLKKGNYALIEKEGRVGGTARSFLLNGFTFDFTGHLLHLHNPYTKALVRRLLKNNFFRCFRNTWIFSHDTYTRYPFQANTYGLPPDVVDDCVLGFADAYFKNQKERTDFSRLNFEEWCRRIFGEGISRHFMIPYNQKLYQTACKNLTPEWCGAFVPQPRLEDVVRGALKSDDKEFGYNATFLYPRKGGIQALPEAFARSLDGVRLNATIRRLDYKKKRAFLSTGEVIHYRNLVSAIPLPELLKIVDSLPSSVLKARAKLKCASILCVNLGVKRAKISDRSWIYFPEREFPFYRVGFPMNFTPHVVPKGCSSMYVEIPLRADRPFSKRRVLAEVRKGLIKASILRASDRFGAVQFLPIRYAYVIYDQARPGALKTIFSFLRDHDIQSIGRYGAWKYSFMEEAILDGKAAAESIR